MKTRNIWIAIVAVLVVLVAAYFIKKEEVQAPSIVPGAYYSNVDSIPNSTTTSNYDGLALPGAAIQATSSPSQYVRVYFVVIGNGGIASTTIGCGDELAPVRIDIPPTKDVLKTALTKLFTIPGAQEERTTFYNALKDSHLKVDSATIVNGVATVKISGTTQLGGECDDPRAIAQIRATVMQFPTIKQANIFINNKKLEDYFSLK